MDLKYYILNEAHETIVCEDVITWAKFFEDHEKRCVNFTKLNDNVQVSTMFLGLDHSFYTGGPPILFETMIFGLSDEYQTRYATWNEAAIGHITAVDFACKEINQ